MSNPESRCLLLAFAIGLAAATAPAAAADRIEVGQPLVEALRLLSARDGLATVFTADTLRPGMRVQAVPTGLDVEALRAALLAQHGLRCRDVHARCVVERVPPAATEARPAEPPPAAARLPQVQVAPSHYGLAGEGVNFLDADEIAATPHLADDVFRLARSIPGVAGGDIGAPFHVRGGQSDEVALRLDGLELIRPFHLHNLVNALGIIDSNLIGGIDVYTGAWPSRFGGRMSAVMDIRSREVEGEREQRLGVSAINAFYTHGRSDPDGEGSLLASARRGYLDAVLKFVDPDGAIDPGYYDVFARYRQRIDERHLLSLHLLHAGDDILFDGERGDQRSDGSAAASYAWLRWQADWSDALASETLLAHTRLDRRREGFAFDRFETNAIVSDRRDASGLRLSHTLDWQADERWSLQAGAEWRSEDTDYAYRSQVEVYPLFSFVPERYTRDIRLRAEAEQFALWTDLRLSLAGRWQLQGGLRHTRYAPGERADGVFDPHLALAWAGDDGQALRLGLAGASQAQRSDELSVEDGDTRFYRPERARIAVLSWEQPLAPRLRLRAEVFHKRWHSLRPRYENLFEPIELFPETESDRIRIAPERARSDGLEIGLDGRFEAGRWWLRYAHARSRERVDGVWQPRSWDQPHSLHLGWDQRFGDGWRLTAQVDAHSGWPTTPVSARLRPDGSIEALVGARNSERFSHYLSVSARLSRERPLRRGSLTWYIEVFNLLDRENGNLVDQFSVFRDAAGNLRITRSLGGGMPILPSFGVVWKF